MDQGKRSEQVELIAVVILGLLLRFLGGRASLTEKGILLPGYDEFYHMRRILYTVQNFPNTLWFDSYLNYPHGWENVWPPLYDQISAAFCLLLGQHTRPGVEMAASFVPIIIGTIATIAVYFLVREVFDHRTAILAGLMTVLAPTYLQYTRFAAMDHHSLEVLFLISALLFLILALCGGGRRYIFAALAGLSIAALAYTWHGAVLYLAVIPAYVAIDMTMALKEKRPSQETAMVMLLALAVAIIFVLPYRNAPWLWPSFVGIAAIFGATVIISTISYLISKRNMSWKAFPPSVLLVFLISILIFSSGPFGTGELIRIGLGTLWGGEMVGKISEAEPLVYDWLTFKQVAFSGLGLNLLFTLAGLAVLLNSIIRSQGCRRQGRIILLLWAAFAIVLTFGQLRFLYMSTIAMGISISILFFHVLNLIKERLGESNPKMVLPAILVLFLVLTLPTIAEVVYAVTYSDPMIKGDWQESMAWLKENSNATSFFDAPEKTPEYSVMSWWDYGNWIMYMAERPVVANNFQAGWEDAAKFYLSESEDNATALMDARGSKYVFLDHSMAYSKLGAIATWANEDLTTYFRAEDYSSSQITVIPTQRLFNTTLGKLYYFDAAGTGHFRLIYESRTFLGENPAKAQIKIFEYVPGALIRISTGPDQKVGCVLNMTSNQNRPFIYANQAEPKDGVLQMRVPYSTEGRYECRAVDPYLVFSGNELGVRMQSVNVSEDDVLNGRTIEVAF
ncbi:MAG: dolichyl-diphosphooligosaccharide--protein glycosyltransferase [Methanosaeta sp. NSM2]|nr:glycosyltransferase family 39 protein [Methanothrix sp.]OYV14893.1 MAG: dolichyl-diphosphooligosaccharide--protein glycosyltransferase [Methanosaeta sp. NSM2]